MINLKHIKQIAEDFDCLSKDKVLGMVNWIERAKPFLIYFMDSDCCSEVEGVDIYQLISEVQDEI